MAAFANRVNNLIKKNPAKVDQVVVEAVGLAERQRRTWADRRGAGGCGEGGRKSWGSGEGRAAGKARGRTEEAG